MSDHDGWIYQGRQEHGWFGDGTKPKDLPEPKDQGLPKDFAARVAHVVDKAGLGADAPRVKRLMPDWALGIKRYGHDFAPKLLDWKAEAPFSQKIRKAVQLTLHARGIDDLDEASRTLAGAKAYLGPAIWRNTMGDAEELARGEQLDRATEQMPIEAIANAIPGRDEGTSSRSGGASSSLAVPGAVPRPATVAMPTEDAYFRAATVCSQNSACYRVMLDVQTRVMTATLAAARTVAGLEPEENQEFLLGASIYASLRAATAGREAALAWLDQNQPGWAAHSSDKADQPPSDARTVPPADTTGTAGGDPDDEDKTMRDSHESAQSPEKETENPPQSAAGGPVERVTLPTNRAQLLHIFREAEGHLTNTPENQQTIVDLVNSRDYYVGTDATGRQWFGLQKSDGTQIWAVVRNGVVQNGGLNMTPRSFDPTTGFSGGKIP